MPDAKFTFQDLKDILVNRVGMSESEVGEDTTATFEGLGLDSLAFLEIQLEVDQRYGIQVADEDAERIKTLQDAIDYMNSQLGD
jgi:acyl carrier protein